MSVPATGWTARNGMLWNNAPAPDLIGVDITDAASLNLRALTRSLAGATTYTLIATLQGGIGIVDSSSFGIYLTDATKYIGLEIVNQSAGSGGTNRLRVQRFTTVTAAGATMAGPTNNVVGYPWTYKIVVDATHRTFFYWAAGAWVQFYQEAAGAYLTETDVGLGGVCNVGNIATAMEGWLEDWSVTTP